MTDQPNVLFIMADQQRHDWLGLQSEVPVRTPHIDRLAERGVWFRNTITPSPICAPARACLATGNNFDRSPVKDNADDLPSDADTYYRRLRDEAGYHVLGCGKFDLHKATYFWGEEGKKWLDTWGFSDGVDNAGGIDTLLSLVWDDHPRVLLDSDEYPDLTRDEIYERGFRAGIEGTGDPADPYSTYLSKRGLLATHAEDFLQRHDNRIEATCPTPLPEDAYIDNWIARNGLELLNNAPDDRPWHLVVNFMGPHSPFDVTNEMHDWYRDPDIEFPPPVNPDHELTAETYQEVCRNYAAMIENIDRWLGRYREELQARSEWESTVVVFASDHGEMLGDHGLWGKSEPYHQSVGVPLVIAGPGIESREPHDGPVNLIDLYDTFLDIAGVPCDESTDSRTLVPFLTGKTDGHREIVRAGLNNWQLVGDDRYRYVEGWTPSHDPVIIDGTECALFDREEDPTETTNFAASHPERRETLASFLD